MSDAQELYVQALKKHRSQDYAAGVELLERAVELDPEHADAWEALGVLYDKVERLEEAIGAIERLLEISPDAIMGWTNLSRFRMKKGDIQGAEDAQAKARLLGWKQDLASGGAGSGDFEQPLRGGDSGPSAPVDIAGLANQAPAAPAMPKKPEPEAIERRIAQFQAILETNPDDLLARLTLGKALLQAERFEEASTMLRELLDRDPERSAAYPLLGEAYEGLGKRARAMSTYEEGIAVAQRKGDLHPRNQMQEALERLR